MADLTGCTGNQVTQVFTSCTDPVMTAFTIAPDTGVGEIRHTPIGRCVA